MTATPYFVYILECADGSLYTGIATEVERRFKEHAAGKGSKYVHARGAKRICYSEQCADKGSALKREIEIKKLSRENKITLTKSFDKKIPS
ncbi:MAG: Excinuclease ABC C subunit domain protein [Candidatus Wolfebacteria bacterium GW2011_GWE1_48_7]|uniref:Excinuclease ABC C subunit domain protein, putative endonuclease n=1 Tax=Candidatus Wolfebacteria bacterium GW2011_GWB1_47_1 TaxID=1619007 RepID=A0A0G4ASG9_9BACT|nr:MAG: excinuclease ABC C subunit domain protein, putative endonuclease [Candidatus Wolfebacteria bacterium GW2011_GWB1_47_1]KKU74498.1 MAG: Excinuclease ABC C subunit domain protein [Candidatus Wolfebacteria bacterium GW2011_GWA1_47_6]KKU99931.1 MAG: Excinuclease ABC C subunit domain protein [Candidatus Wolfebacteria bacterium GW2011_GWE1_48_7]HAL24528.1 GIY-YIG nuclease family protein [Candidatus Wolfebacteria bacterium]HAS95317.1 GIY-YIG nuclease family protein [Candidatus Wolfebacteria bac